MKINKNRDRQIDKDEETFTSMGARKYVMILFIKDGKILTGRFLSCKVPPTLTEKRQRKIQE